MEEDDLSCSNLAPDRLICNLAYFKQLGQLAVTNSSDAPAGRCTKYKRALFFGWWVSHQLASWVICWCTYRGGAIRLRIGDTVLSMIWLHLILNNSIVPASVICINVYLCYSYVKYINLLQLIISLFICSN